MDKRMFTASVELDRKTMFEFYHTHGPLWQRVVFFITVPITAMVLIGARWFLPWMGKFPYWLWLLLSLINWWRMNRSVHRITDENNRKPPYNKLTITHSGIRIINPNKETETHHTFDEYQSAWRSRNLLYLSMDKKRGQLIDLRTVAGGTPEELMDFIRDHCPHWKKPHIPKRFDNRILSRILVALAVVGLLTSTGGSSFSTPRVMDTREAADTLTELGITGITEETIQEIEAFYEEYDLDGSYNPVPDLLYYAGSGEYDPETWEWTPAESGVYTFDMEAWEVSMMYTDLLTGISAMSGGELEFADVVEDNSGVDEENGTGFKTVSFTFRGERYSLTAEMMYDWYDLNWINELARIVNSTGGEKKLRFLNADYQLINVFYQDNTWTRQFRKLTGYALSTEISYY